MKIDGLDILTPEELEATGLAVDGLAVWYDDEIIMYTAHMNKWSTAMYRGEALRSVRELRDYIDKRKKAQGKVKFKRLRAFKLEYQSEVVFGVITSYAGKERSGYTRSTPLVDKVWFVPDGKEGKEKKTLTKLYLVSDHNSRIIDEAQAMRDEIANMQKELAAGLNDLKFVDFDDLGIEKKDVDIAASEIKDVDDDEKSPMSL